MNQVTPMPSASALQDFLSAHPPPTSSSPNAAAYHHLALQIAHNLRHQHLWTDVRLHTHSSHSTAAASEDATTKTQPLPRPLVTGIPPQRLYVHPDEQLELLQAQKDAEAAAAPVSSGGQSAQGIATGASPTQLPPEREWVLPSHLRERWTLRRFGETFDAIGAVPQPNEGISLFERDGAEGQSAVQESVSAWRGKLPKRALLATLDDDSTITYYIVHDGIVKPRQN